jgi:enterochelin esterase family protein
MEGTVGPSCGADELTFHYADPERRLTGVRLRQAVGVPGDRLDFSHADGVWNLTVPRPPIWRMEYQLELRHPDGGTEQISDPGNPRRVGGAFGDKSVLECPGYAEPEWLHWDGPPESTQELAIMAPGLNAEVRTRIWSPITPTDRILVANDGPDYDKFASLTQYCAAMVGAGVVPPHHLVLLTPCDRNEWYSANPAYARALTGEVLLRVRAELGSSRPIVGLGASLGALAMLQAQRRHPATFAGLFLQSGSFFLPRYDQMESRFPRYTRIVRFAGRVVRADTARAVVPTTITVGKAEENLLNNRVMAQALRRQGYPVELAEVPDAHNFTGWRDALHPHLTSLLRRVWTRDAVDA